jgi:hypothetical protein
MDTMGSAFVPPTDPVAREMIIASTKPNSLKRKIKLALLALNVGRRGIFSPCILWLSHKKN